MGVAFIVGLVGSIFIYLLQVISDKYFSGWNEGVLAQQNISREERLQRFVDFYLIKVKKDLQEIHQKILDKRKTTTNFNEVEFLTEEIFSLVDKNASDDFVSQMSNQYSIPKKIIKTIVREEYGEAFMFKEFGNLLDE